MTSREGGGLSRSSKEFQDLAFHFDTQSICGKKGITMKPIVYYTYMRIYTHVFKYIQYIGAPYIYEQYGERQGQSGRRFFGISPPPISQTNVSVRGVFFEYVQVFVMEFSFIFFFMYDYSDTAAFFQELKGFHRSTLNGDT